MNTTYMLQMVFGYVASSKIVSYSLSCLHIQSYNVAHMHMCTHTPSTHMIARLHARPRTHTHINKEHMHAREHTHGLEEHGMKSFKGL